MKSLYKLWMMTFIILLSVGSLKCQTTVSFGYDDAGNRVSRTIVLPKQSSLKSAKIDTAQSSQQLNEQKTFEEQLSDQKVTIYPNPTKGELRIDITEFDPSKVSVIKVFNLSGTLVLSKTPLSGSDLIDLSESPTGTYVLKIQLGEKVSDWKIVKE